MRTLLAVTAAFSAVLVACVPPPAVRQPKVRTTFAFQPIKVDGMAPRWGAASVGPFIVGGVTDSTVVTDDLFKIAADDTGVHGSALVSLTKKRMCHCALFDDTRSELLVIGGRDAQFLDNNDAEIVNTDTGAKTTIDHGGAADHPIGCQAFFSKSADKGWIFGGLSSTVGGFTADTFRYDPAAHSITKLDITGPGARYDAGVHQLDNGDVIMIGGYGVTGVPAHEVLYNDVWRFDAANETWTQLSDNDATGPKGRRYPWTSMAPDESMVLFGFGSDSGTGSTVLGDLWSFTFDTGAWAELPVDGDLPSARGFTYNMRGPDGTAGVLAFGTTGGSALTTLTDAYVMRVPDSMSGTWH